MVASLNYIPSNCIATLPESRIQNIFNGHEPTPITTMERLAKRQRLFATSDGRFPNKFDNHHEFYQSPHRELEEEEDEEEEVEEDFSPDEELQNKRAQLDYKLKSTFESIFAKYERNFDGIGDEIDLYTGEILVNNGHLLRMDDEKDAGISIDSHSRLGYTTPETEEATNSSMGEDHEDIEEEEVDEEEGSSDDEMPDDDLLLRGFAQASQFMKQKLSPEPPSFIDAFYRARIFETLRSFSSEFWWRGFSYKLPNHVTIWATTWT